MGTGFCFVTRFGFAISLGTAMGWGNCFVLREVWNMNHNSMPWLAHLASNDERASENEPIWYNDGYDKRKRWQEHKCSGTVEVTARVYIIGKTWKHVKIAISFTRWKRSFSTTSGADVNISDLWQSSDNEVAGVEHLVGSWLLLVLTRKHQTWGYWDMTTSFAKSLFKTRDNSNSRGSGSTSSLYLKKTIDIQHLQKIGKSEK